MSVARLFARKSELGRAVLRRQQCMQCTLFFRWYCWTCEPPSKRSVPFVCTLSLSSLTGEGDAHTKVVSALEPTVRGESAAANDHGGIPLAECKNMVFMGTLTCGGHAKAVVTATGKSKML